MKVITLYQPWASLIALGEKKFETRSWEPKNFRGPIAIHSAITVPPAVRHLFHEEPFISAFKDRALFPVGSVIAIADLVDCLRVVSRVKISGNQFVARLENEQEITGNELYFGDYTPGRFAWQFENVHRLAEPIQAKGMQRIWNWDETPQLISIETRKTNPWACGATKIWTPNGIRVGQRCELNQDGAVLGLEVTA